MNKSSREDLILSLLHEQGYVSVKEIAKITYTSEASIRRDLTHLEKKQLVKRSYGGVSLINNNSFAIPFAARKSKNAVLKKSAAKKAATLLKDGMSVMLDGSSTTMFLLPYIREFKNIKLFCNNMYTVSSAADMGIYAYCLGGKIYRDSSVLSGPIAENAVENLNPDILFFSSQCVDKDGNISDSTESENRLRKIMISRANITVFIYDTEKLNTYALYKLCNINDVDFAFHN